MQLGKPQVGKLRHKVLFKQRTTGSVGPGDESTTWTTVFTGWALIEPMSGRERELAGALQGIGAFTITMRYHAGITTAMRVDFGTRIFNILSPPRNVEERGDFMVIDVQEGSLQP